MGMPASVMPSNLAVRNANMEYDVLVVRGNGQHGANAQIHQNGKHNGKVRVYFAAQFVGAAHLGHGNHTQHRKADCVRAMPRNAGKAAAPA